MFPKQFSLLCNNIFKVEVFTTATPFSKTITRRDSSLTTGRSRTALPGSWPAGGARGQLISKPEARGVSHTEKGDWWSILGHYSLEGWLPVRGDMELVSGTFLASSSIIHETMTFCEFFDLHLGNFTSRNVGANMTSANWHGPLQYSKLPEGICCMTLFLSREPLTNMC